MKKEVLPIKSLPKEFKLGGDYYATQSALILGTLSEKDLSIRNFNTGVETDLTIEFIKSIGLEVMKNDKQIRIETGYGINIPDETSLKYDGTSYPLSLIVGFLAGRNKSCTLKYSSAINPDIVDTIVDIFNNNGIDAFHEAEDELIVFRSSTELPVEIKINCTIPHIKNCFMIFSLSSGISVSIKEYVTTSDHLERCLERLGVPFKIYEPKTIVKEDPVDPRKKIRTREAEYRRNLIFPASLRIEATMCHMPSDIISTAAIITLAVMKKKNVKLEKVAINRVSTKFLNFLKSSAADITITNREEIDGETVGTVEVKSKAIKAKKMSGGQAATLIDELPFMAVMASLGDGTTIIRGVADYNDSGIAPFTEIALNLEKMGIKSGVLEDGLAVEGGNQLVGTDFESFVNNKVGLAFYIAALAGDEPSTFDNFELLQNNYPVFVNSIQG